MRIDITDNGYITIDVTDDEAFLLKAEAHTRGADDLAQRLAQTIAGHQRVEPMSSLRKKMGIANRGWTATFIDHVRRGEFLAARGIFKP